VRPLKLLTVQLSAQSGGKLQSQLGIREVDTISSRECVMCQHLPAFTPSCGWQPFIFFASDVREGSGANRHSLADDANKQSPDSLGSASGAALLTDKVWQVRTRWQCSDQACRTYCKGSLEVVAVGRSQNSATDKHATSPSINYATEVRVGQHRDAQPLKGL